jgi:hypothetical protein
MKWLIYLVVFLFVYAITYDYLNNQKATVTVEAA